MACSCITPAESPNPRHKGECCKCGRVLDRAITDGKVRSFFDALEDAARDGAEDFDQAGFGYFRALCEHRERDGRERFGQSFLSKECIGEAFEEAADLAIYPLLDSIKEHVRPSDDPDLALVLSAAHHAYISFEMLRSLAGKRKGSP